MNTYILTLIFALFAFGCSDFTLKEYGGDTDNGQSDDQTDQTDQTDQPDLSEVEGSDPTDQTDDTAIPDDDATLPDDDTVTPDVDTLPENACNEGEICWHIIDTGQVECYNLTGVMVCSAEGNPFYGQDAHYSGGGREYQQRTTSGPMLIEDNQTKLWWQQTIDTTTRNWSDADSYCAGLASASYGDRSDWRLPTRQELMSLLLFVPWDTEPLIDETNFPGTPADTFWTGTKHGYNYYYVDFSGDGMSYSDPAETLHLARCVSSPWNYLSARPIQRWIETTVDADDIIEDSLTGLIWQPDFAGDNTLLWEDALAYCAGLNYAQKSDWRLPDINELQSLITIGAQPEHVSTFPGMTEDYFWSSTTNAKDITKAWTAEFKYGIVRPDSMWKDGNTNGIRTICVRNKD